MDSGPRCAAGLGVILQVRKKTRKDLRPMTAHLNHYRNEECLNRAVLCSFRMQSFLYPLTEWVLLVTDTVLQYVKYIMCGALDFLTNLRYRPG